MGHVVRDLAFRARASRRQVRPSGLVIAGLVSALLWAGLIFLIVSVF